MILFSIIGLLLVVYAIIVNDMMKDTYYQMININEDIFLAVGIVWVIGVVLIYIVDGIMKETHYQSNFKQGRMDGMGFQDKIPQ